MKGNTTTNCDLALLAGFLAPVSGEDYQRLTDARHPSLYESAGRCFIVFGPLSLINHACESLVGFGRPKKLLAAAFPLLARNSTDHDEIGEEWEMQLLQIKGLDAECKHPGWKAGQQILVRYGDKPANCNCKACAKLGRERKRRKQQAT